MISLLFWLLLSLIKLYIKHDSECLEFFGKALHQIKLAAKKEQSFTAI